MLKELVKDFFGTITYFLKSNVRMFSSLLEILLPYGMYFAGQYTINKGSDIIVDGMILIPLFIYFVAYLMKSYANKIGKGNTVPVPAKRFTEIHDGDEVLVENDRIQELILYVADLEDWLERKGML